MSFDVERHGSKESLLGFSGRKLTAPELQAQLARCLNISLTIEETEVWPRSPLTRGPL